MLEWQYLILFFFYLLKDLILFFLYIFQIIICSDVNFANDCKKELKSYESESSSHISVVSPMWILDSITNYELQSPDIYLFSP